MINWYTDTSFNLSVLLHRWTEKDLPEVGQQNLVEQCWLKIFLFRKKGGKQNKKSGLSGLEN